MKILNKKDSLILRVRKTNQLICLGWYQVNCENSTLSALGEFVRPWRGFVNKWYQDIRHYFQDIIGVREDEGRVWHLVTCNLCTPTFGVTIPVTILVTSRNPPRWISGRGRGYGGPCPSPMVSNVHINNLIWNNVRTTSRHQSFTSVAVCYNDLTPPSSSGLYSQSYLHPPKISLLPPPEVTRVRCLVNQDKKPRNPVQRKPTFLMKLRGKDGGKKEEPLRNAYFTSMDPVCCNLQNPLYLIHCWNMSICLRKLPLPEIFYNNNDFELIDNLSDREEERPENQDDHER